jgi:16S rRNA (guanine527-N7)-methyltransferase
VGALAEIVAAALPGLTLSADQEAAFDIYAAALAEWNAHTNLTAITALDDVRVRHFLDSLTILAALSIPQGAHVIDVGTGAGFPGLPLRIARPDLRLTLIEATGKKLNFCRHVAELLGLGDVQFVHARAEEAGHLPALREQGEVVVARAVARLPVLLEYLLPLAQVGGVAVAMKGRTAAAEAADSKRALKLLGGKVRGLPEFALPGIDEPHALVLIDKTAPTPAGFPRRPGLPAQKPL